MSEIKEFISVSEAVRLSFKPEVTIRRLIKRLSNDTQTQSIVTVTDPNNSKLLYQIDRNYLIKLYNLDDNHTTVKEISNDNHMVVMQQFIDSLLNQLESKDEQLKRRDEDIARTHQLLENQQKMTLHSQLQIEKLQLSLTTGEKKEETKKRKKVLGIF